MSSLAERRARVNRLLTEAASHKLLRAGTSHALERAREAHELASAPPKLQPWAALAAYRLAHLVLRDPRTQETLEEADALFAEAAREPLLGPYPRIYRLALLGRLGASRAVVERTFAEAVSAHDAWVRGRDASAPSVPIQTDLFAMLELAGYFLDLDRAPLEGRGARPDEPYLGDAHWRLVGPDPGLADVSVSEATALAELDALAPTLVPAFVFRLPPDRAGAVLRFAEGPWLPLPHRAARLLACLLRQHAADARQLTVRVMGSDGRAQQTALRQVRHRLAEQLRARGLRLPDELVVTAPGERPRLAPGLVVLGAVSDAGYADTDPD
ncbi:MAG: hypothetical protein HS104_07030 [Polyangiaceae bacterium]|nr:hypothetical protein [Polyangiaceae bacterium]MCL4754170.1 hypothetical protein [Myxococcales bacterium]